MLPSPEQQWWPQLVCVRAARARARLLQSPTMRPRLQWNLARRSLQLGERTLVMGILNVTPDSFSDGGRYFNPEAAISRGLDLLDDECADILDIGGESTRPGTAIDSPLSPGREQAVSARQELDRVLPVLEGLRRARPEAILSIDTYKSTVASAALDAGADIVNDVSGLTWDPEMASTVAARRCGVVLMHTRGTPAEWRDLPPLPDPTPLVLNELRSRAGEAIAAGIARDSIVLDPGFGFGKRLDENYPLLARLRELRSIGYPLLVGLSRKSFLTRTARSAQYGPPPLAGEPFSILSPHREVYRLYTTVAGLLTGAQKYYGLGDVGPALHALAELQLRADADAATLAASVAAALAGAHIVRVHAVRPAVEALAIADAILNAAPE
jgi:dihydropteroate synthase